MNFLPQVQRRSSPRSRRRYKRRRKILDPLRLFLTLLSIGLFIGILISGAVYMYVRPSATAAPTYWETLGSYYYRQLIWTLFVAFLAAITLLALRVSYQLASKRPPMDDKGFWRVKGILLGLTGLFFVELFGLAVQSLDAYYAYYDAAHPAQGEGKYLKGVTEGGKREISLDINNEVKTFRAPLDDGWKAIKWNESVLFQYGEKTGYLATIEVAPVPEAPPLEQQTPVEPAVEKPTTSSASTTAPAKATSKAVSKPTTPAKPSASQGQKSNH
ncbi:hypothetical protein [Heliobacterium chlorum]|uniref:hypothetical protein n=1 Tax=Heliobacterium chlorum TaxID=2698 RepID=UPI00165DC64A|nr:hypothetical protein [Heliobacterium chlorum]